MMGYTNRTGRRVALIGICYDSYDDMFRKPVNTWTGPPWSLDSCILSKIMYFIQCHNEAQEWGIMFPCVEVEETTPGFYWEGARKPTNTQ